MVFNSVSYLIFFPVVILVTFLVPARVRYIWLLAASYFFYMSWNAGYGLLLLTSTVITYVCGIGMDCIHEKTGNAQKARIWKRLILTVGLTVNFGMLFYFKYINFVVKTIRMISCALRMDANLPDFDILLPIGISFFVFQAVGYTIDVYRNHIRAERNFMRYALFISFFPQLVAGPIERSQNLLSQLRRPPRFDAKHAENGLLTIVYGLFLKIVIADNIALLIDPIYQSIGKYNGMQLLFATILFAFQIYCDFNGYTLMAIGSAEALGYRLNKNFDSPYLAAGVRDFWRRWHISLTSWFRDYLYIPLGGSKKGRFRKHLNTMAVFLCSGLWHGAAWKFIAWGGVNGIFSILEDMFTPACKKLAFRLRIDTQKISYKIAQRLATFFLVDFTWLFFRANSFLESFKILRSIKADFKFAWLLNLEYISIGSYKTQMIVLLSLIFMGIVDFTGYRGKSVRDILFNQQIVFRWIAYWIFFMLILYWGAYGTSSGQTAFIYFQF